MSDFVAPVVAVADLGLVAVPLPFVLFAPACCPLMSAFGGVKELSVASLPKFMKLAGVTGMIGVCIGTGVCAGVCSEDATFCIKPIGVWG